MDICSELLNDSNNVRKYNTAQCIPIRSSNKVLPSIDDQNNKITPLPFNKKNNVTSL